MRSLDIYCNDLVKNNERSIRSCTIEAKDGNRITSSKILKFELPSYIKIPDDNDAESYLIATILSAMAENRRLKIHGVVSRKLLSNLTEFRDAWNCWLPNLYGKIDLEAITIKDSLTTGTSSAISGFSGGLDSTFTVWHNSQGLAGYRTQNIKDCVMVRGFDIFKEDDYKNAFDQAKKTLKELEIPLIPLHTNYRSIIEEDWNHTHGIALAACLNNFKNLHKKGIIAGSYPYHYNYYPTGSNQITDPLLSSSTFEIVYDGGQFTKDQKAVGISQWKGGVNNLRVCYSAEQKHTNCGKCFKCIHTNLQFESSGLERPDSIPKLKSGKAIKRLILRRRVIAQYFIDSLRLAKVNNIRVKFKWSYYYMIYKSRIIRGIIKPKIVRIIGKKLYYIVTGKVNLS